MRAKGRDWGGRNKRLGWILHRGDSGRGCAEQSRPSTGSHVTLEPSRYSPTFTLLPTSWLSVQWPAIYKCDRFQLGWLRIGVAKLVQLNYPRFLWMCTQGILIYKLLRNSLDHLQSKYSTFDLIIVQIESAWIQEEFERAKNNEKRRGRTR